MKHKVSKQFLSALLAFVMIVGLIPASTLTVFAVGNVVVTHDVDEIRELLRSDGDVSIKLDADAEKKLTAYSDFENYQTDKWNSQYVWTKIGSGNKTIDLNGHRLYVYDQSARSLGSLDWLDFRYIQGALLMEIPEGTSLTVNDSSGGGKILMDAEMPDKSQIEGSGLLMERNIFAVTGGNLTVNGGEIHAGRSKEIYAQNATKYDKDYDLIPTGSLFGVTLYDHLYGYATWFLSGTAITAESGNVTINGGDIWGRGWDNWTLITRVPGAPNGADDFRDRCAALRLLGDSTAHIAGGNFYGRSDADAVQVSNPNNLTVDAGSFDVGTNSWLVVPGVDLGGTSDAINNVFFHDSVFEVHKGFVGSFGIPNECINDQSVKVVKGNTMTLSKNSIDPYKVIDEVNIYINSPLAYETPAEEVYNVPDGCTVKSVTWYHNGSKVDNPKDTYFVKGDSYYVKIALSVDNSAGTKFKNNLTNVTINGKDVELYRADEENIVLTLYFGACIAALEEVEFEVIEPVDGGYANSWVDTSEYELYAPVGGYSNYGDFRTWYVSDDGENWTEMDSEATFEAGKYYRFSFEVHTGEGQQFAVDASGVSVQPDVSATVNGISATVSKTYEQDPSEHITVTVDFGKCPALIHFVELTVTAPKDSQTISYNVTAGADSYYAIKDGNNNSTYRRWYQSDTGYDGWAEMSPGSAFVAGKYYKFEIDVYCKSGYEFSVYDDGTSIQPNVAACVNNYGAKVSKSYEQDPSRYITVTYFFGICNSSVVSSITVTNVTPPVAGEKPNYTYSIEGNGYQMDTSKNAYYDVYWKNPPEQWYYVKNGISWWDVTDGGYEYVYENDPFITGHQYQCKVYLKVEDGFEFANNDGTPTVTATMNGNVAGVTMFGSGLQWEQQVTYTFTCTQPTIDTIILYNLDAPQAGKTPDTEVTAAYPELYVVDSVRWLDVEDNEVNSFEQGQYYAVEIVVDAKDYDGVDGCIFANEVTAYIDGKEVTGWTNSVTNVNNILTVRYSFRNGASAPEVGYSVSGTVTSFNDTEGDVTLQLFYGSSPAPSYTTVVKGNTVDYSFADVAAGTYTLKVSKDNHVTREYTVVVGDSSVIQDVKIHLLGDINGDGSITMIDFGRANSHAKGVSILTGYELMCADTVGQDGVVGVVDAARINAHAKGGTKLW